VLRLEHSVIAPLSAAGTREIWVVFTGSDYIAGALAMAAGIAAVLSAQICILAAQVVPYPLPLADPPVGPEFLERSLLDLAQEFDVDTTVEIYLCRDAAETLNQILPVGATVVIGGRKRWWRTAEQRLADALAQHQRTILFHE